MIVDLTINTVTSLVTAIATVGTIIVALWQLKRTLDNNDRERREDLYHRISNAAYHVDAWVAANTTTECNTRCIIIRNGSSGAIRDVSMRVLWPSKKHVTISHAETYAPGTAQPWRILPHGIWLVEKTDKEKYQWRYPRRISEEELCNYVPQFKSADYEILSISFTDIYNNKWRRSVSLEGKETGSIELTYTENSRLQSFIVPFKESQPMRLTHSRD